MSLRKEQLLCPFCNGTVAFVSINAIKTGAMDNLYAFKCNACGIQGQPSKTIDAAWSSFVSMPPLQKKEI